MICTYSLLQNCVCFHCVLSLLLIKCRIAEHFASPVQNSWHTQRVTQRGWWASTQMWESESLLQDRCLSPCFSVGWTDCPQHFCMVSFSFQNPHVGCSWISCFVVWNASTTRGEHLSLCCCTERQGTDPPTCMEPKACRPFIILEKQSLFWKQDKVWYYMCGHMWVCVYIKPKCTCVYMYSWTLILIKRHTENSCKYQPGCGCPTFQFA